MCWCGCRLACNLLHSFQSLSWGWVWMVLWILMLFSIFYCTAGKLKRCRNLRGPFTLFLDRNGSEEVDCNSVAVDRYIVSFDDWSLLRLENGSVLVWFLGTLRLELAHMLFQRWVQMGFSSPEVSCEVCELTRLWMLCRVDPRGLVRLSGLGSRWTHPRRSPSSARSWSSTLPI